MSAPLGTHASVSSLASIAQSAHTHSRSQSQPEPELPRAIPPSVEYVLLAEFDIDQGSVVRHEYPVHTGVDQHLLAEHMLPDGAHDRTEDWTVFYLNQIQPLTVVEPSHPREPGLLYVLSLVRTKKDASVRRGALVKALAVATRNPYIQIYKPILLLALEDYFATPSVAVLARLYNAINAIDTSALPFLTLDERTILRTSDRKDMFEEKFKPHPHHQHHALDRAPSTKSQVAPQTGADDASITEVLQPISKARSSGSISSLASVSRPPRPPSSSAATTTYNGASSSVEDLTSSPYPSRSRANTVTSSEGGGDGYSQSQRDLMYQNAANHALPTSSSSHYEPTPGSGWRTLPPSGATGGMKPKDTHWYETKVAYGGFNLPIRIPLGTYPSEIGDYSLINLIQTFSAPNSLVPSPVLHPALHSSGHQTHPIILLFNALVTGHRVVFLGHGLPAGKVADMVLAACALASGCGTVLAGFEERCFPYTNLSNLDNLENVPGYIAGVCNPAFADRPTWWDVLCNLETGKITVSKDLRRPTSTSGSNLRGLKLDPNSMERAGEDGHKEKDKDKGDKGDHADNLFMEEILHAIQSHYGESVIRARFTEYATRFVRLSSKWEEETCSITSIGFPCAPWREGRLGSGVVFWDEGQGMKDLQRDSARIEGWMATKGYTLYQQAFRESLESAPLRDFDLIHQLSRLRLGRQLSTMEVTLILQTLVQSVKSDSEIIALLAHLPSHSGGLLPLAFGLFHPSPIVRAYTLELFDLVGSHPTGKKFVSGLNAFHRAAYNRLSFERQQLYEQEKERERMLVAEQAAGLSTNGRDREATVTMNAVKPGPPSLPPPVPTKDV
ncbi:AFI1/MesA family protein [Sporobolomyces koalae]|uniref:AFI1/MesA family protein n=1 Tax=Sporobolomyces koalae TaxID=500713 RepID=UPI0031778D40